MKPTSHLKPWQELECPACGLVVDALVVRSSAVEAHFDAVCEECGATIKPLPATAEVLRRVTREAP